MISEMLFLILCLLFVKQASALWNSVVIIITSFVLLFNMTMKEAYSTMLILILLFVGGLLILLVFVCSLAYNDTSSLIQYYLIAFMLLLIMGSMNWELAFQSAWSSDLSPILTAFYSKDLMSILYPLIMLFVVFLVLTFLMLEYSGMARQV